MVKLRPSDEQVLDSADTTQFTIDVVTSCVMHVEERRDAICPHVTHTIRSSYEAAVPRHTVIRDVRVDQ